LNHESSAWPPNLGQLTVNALTAVDGALLITEPRAPSVEGPAQTPAPWSPSGSTLAGPFDPIGAAAVP